MRPLLLTLLLFFMSDSFAQMYSDYSDLIPDSMAYGWTLDVAAADIDNDGDIDFIQANNGESARVLLNNGGGAFIDATPSHFKDSLGNTNALAIADFDGNGIVDFVLASRDIGTFPDYYNITKLFMGDPNGGFTQIHGAIPWVDASIVKAADIDKDGDQDLVFASFDPSSPTPVFINNGDSTFTREDNRVPQLRKRTTSLTFEDINTDGFPDLIETSTRDVRIYINDQNGHFQDGTIFRLVTPTNRAYFRATFGDIDNDGDRDMYISSIQSTPTGPSGDLLYQNNGSGGFTNITSGKLPINSGFSPDAAFVDIDRDNDLDIIVISLGPEPIKAYLNDGSGFFSDAKQAVFGQDLLISAYTMLNEDFNNDGLSDLYIPSYPTGQNDSIRDILLLRNANVSLDKDKPLRPAIFPNPFKNTLTIDLKNKEVTHVDVFDMQGRLKKSIELSPGESEVVLESLPSGTYLLKLRLEEGVFWEKIVKE